MTPARARFTRSSRSAGRLAAAAIGVLLLALLFIPGRDSVTHALSLEWRPSAELAGLLFVVAIIALARPQLVSGRRAALFLAVIVGAMALLNLADAAIPTMLGRDLNLYWDLRHLPSLFGLAGGAAGLWRVAAAIAVFVVAMLLATAATYWIWRKVLAGLTDRRIALGAAVVLGVALDLTAFLPAAERPLAIGPGLDLARQTAAFARGEFAGTATGGTYAPALAAPAPPPSQLAGLKRRDVYLVYLESYGTIIFDTPEFRATLGEALTQFESSLREAGYTVASNRLVSPTYGGGSWLAHATMASGIRLDDPVLYTLLLDSGRKLLPGYFKDAGWRAIDIMPGTKTPSPKAQAWGFDREVFATELNYRGPSFGWFEIPDQFTLDRATTIRTALGPEPPVFTQIVLVSSHMPFSPVPPYLTDWRDTGTFSSVPAAQLEEVYRQPDWSRLAPDYLRSLSYDFTVLGEWLGKHVGGDGLVILLGDHQPPAVVGGQPQPPWTVPIHVLSRDPKLVAPFIADGYFDGLFPTQKPPHPGMEEFLGRFLAAFDRPG
jgi:hypothetical protein